MVLSLGQLGSRVGSGLGSRLGTRLQHIFMLVLMHEVNLTSVLSLHTGI